MATESNTKTHETTKQLNRSSGSFELAFAPVILGLLGLWLDRTVGTTPLFVISFSILGFLGTGIKLYFAYRYEMAEIEADVAWVGHESSGEFRKHRAERLVHNSNPGNRTAQSEAPEDDASAVSVEDSAVGS